MRSASTFAALLAGALIVLSTAAHAATIRTLDFTFADTDSFFTIDSPYQEDGFQVEALIGSLAAFGLNNGNVPSFAVHNNRGNAPIRLTKIGGGLFNLHEIDLTEFDNDGDPNLEFTGALLGGGTVSQTFDFDGVFGTETFQFTGFNNVLSVEWVQAAPFHQFDNIVVSTPVPAAAPLAASGLALFGLIALARRRRR